MCKKAAGCIKRFLLFTLLTLSAHAAEDGRLYIVTAYCHCAKCCGRADRPGANGKLPTAGITAAGPRSLPLGTKLVIEGVGERIVEDRQSKRFDDRIDIFMPDHQAAVKFGVRKLHVTRIKKS